MNKLRRMRLAGHVAWMGRRGMQRGFWWEREKVKKTYLEDRDLYGSIILEWIFEK
jgi:hypothetical protein